MPTPPSSSRSSRSLGDRRTLVVLDNCEHLLGAVASLSREILERCPGTTLLATSREPLGLGGRAAVPAGRAQPGGGHRAVRHRGPGVRGPRSIRPTRPSTASVTGSTISRWPCSWPRPVPAPSTWPRSSRCSMTGSAHLRSSTVDRPNHHQTLGTAIAWSFDALGPELQQLLCDLSVLTGRFTLDEARAVAGGADAPAVAIVDRLDVLVRRSLIAGPGPGRGPDRLPVAGEHPAVRPPARRPGSGSRPAPRPLLRRCRGDPPTSAARLAGRPRLVPATVGRSPPGPGPCGGHRAARRPVPDRQRVEPVLPGHRSARDRRVVWARPRSRTAGDPGTGARQGPGQLGLAGHPPGPHRAGRVARRPVVGGRGRPSGGPPGRDADLVEQGRPPDGRPAGRTDPGVGRHGAVPRSRRPDVQGHPRLGHGRRRRSGGGSARGPGRRSRPGVRGPGPVRSGPGGGPNRPGRRRHPFGRVPVPVRPPRAGRHRCVGATGQELGLACHRRHTARRAGGDRQQHRVAAGAGVVVVRPGPAGGSRPPPSPRPAGPTSP